MFEGCLGTFKRTPWCRETAVSPTDVHPTIVVFLASIWKNPNFSSLRHRQEKTAIRATATILYFCILYRIVIYLIRINGYRQHDHKLDGRFLCTRVHCVRVFSKDTNIFHDVSAPALVVSLKGQFLALCFFILFINDMQDVIFPSNLTLYAHD